MQWGFRSRPRLRSEELEQVADWNLPQHLGIIMDGNGRWAKRRGLPRMAGHHAGMNAMKEAIRACDDCGISCVTLYAFSTENWKRPENEVEYLMKLPDQFFRSEMDELVQRGVRLKFIGETHRLPTYTQETVRLSLERTAHNTGMIVTFALNYGGRRDIVEATKRLLQDVEQGLLSVDDIDESAIAARLSTRDLVDPDLIIRTSGELRLSNFLVWQSAYSELWFTDTLWPDFTKSDLLAALHAFHHRKRRFGDVK